MKKINKLIKNDFIYRQQDEQDSRAYKLYLTKKAKKIIPELHREIDSIIGLITEDLSEKELDITMASLEKIFLSNSHSRNCSSAAISRLRLTYRRLDSQ